MRRVIPLVLVGVLTVGAVAGAAVALSGAPHQRYQPSGALAPTVRGPYVPPVPLASPSVLHRFHAAVRATLDAKSFVYQVGSAVAYYNAPNRVRLGHISATQSDIEVFVGNTMYSSFETVRPGTVNSPRELLWTSARLPSRYEILNPITTARGFLKALLRATHIARHHNDFLVNMSLTLEGQTDTQDVTVSLGGGHVVNISLSAKPVTSVPVAAVAEPPPQTHSCGPGCVSSSIGAQPTTISFSFVNHAPVVKPPPPSEVERCCPATLGGKPNP